jgi:hypothetical protein
MKPTEPDHHIFPLSPLKSGIILWDIWKKAQNNVSRLVVIFVPADQLHTIDTETNLQDLYYKNSELVLTILL